MRNFRRFQGFTLLELILVLVVLGVLSALAVPVYTSAVEKARKQEAYKHLGAVRLAQQRYYSYHGTYTGVYNQLDFDPTQTAAGNVAHFSYDPPVVAGSTYTVTAHRNGQDFPAFGGAPAGYTVRINQDGVITSQY